MQIANRHVHIAGLFTALSLLVLLGGNSAFAQSASQCVDVVYTSNNPGAFFKGRMYNGCNRTIWVSYCKVERCGKVKGYYDSAVTIRPGQYKPVDTEGHGVNFAACIYEAPDYDTPNSNNRGKYACD